MPLASLLKFAGAGVLATLVMDLGGTAMHAAGLVAGVPPKFIGRWFAHLFRGRLVHHTIADAPDLPGQMPLAILCHYCIGATLGLGFALLMHYGPIEAGTKGRAFGFAVVYGLFTNVFPWLLMFPAMGFGWLGLQGPPESMLLRSSFLNHLGYGLGLGLMSMWMTSLWTRV